MCYKIIFGLYVLYAGISPLALCVECSNTILAVDAIHNALVWLYDGMIRSKICFGYRFNELVEQNRTQL